MRILFLMLLGLATSAHAIDGDALLRQIDESMGPASYAIYRKLINIRSDGSRREYVMFTLKKDRDKVVNLFLEPPDEYGRVMLRVGENMWLKIPDVEQALRVSSMHSVVGGIFNNWDIMQSEFSSEYAVQQTEAEDDTYALTLRAKNRWAIYDRLRLWAGKQDLLPRKIEAFSTAGVLLKTVTFRDIKDFGDGIVRPAVMETESPLWPGVKAVMVFAEMRRRELSDEIFTVNYMSRIGDLTR